MMGNIAQKLNVCLVPNRSFGGQTIKLRKIEYLMPVYIYTNIVCAGLHEGQILLEDKDEQAKLSSYEQVGKGNMLCALFIF